MTKQEQIVADAEAREAAWVAREVARAPKFSDDQRNFITLIVRNASKRLQQKDIAA